MFPDKQRPTGSREVDFTPDDAMYQLYRNTRNPYVIRAIAPAMKKLERSGQDLGRLFRVMSGQQGYQVAPVNTLEPYQRRDLPHPKIPAATEPRYLKAENLSGDFSRLPWLIAAFFKTVLSRLAQDPPEFEAVVEDLMVLLRENKVQIKLYDAYQALEDWDDLMDTLREIANYPAPETFDLFCSALLTYYRLVYGRG